MGDWDEDEEREHRAGHDEAISVRDARGDDQARKEALGTRTLDARLDGDALVEVPRLVGEETCRLDNGAGLVGTHLDWDRPGGAAVDAQVDV